MTATKIPRPAHRPLKNPPAGAVAIILETAATGATKKGVAQALGTSFETFDRWLTENADLREAFEKGREKERATLHNVLYTTATTGSGKEKLIAAMFLLKARHGYREGEQEQQGNRVNVTFNIPGAMKPTEFVQEVANARIE